MGEGFFIFQLMGTQEKRVKGIFKLQLLLVGQNRKKGIDHCGVTRTRFEVL